MAPTRAKSNNTKKRRGRPPGSRKSDAVTKPTQKRTGVAKKPKRGRPSRDDAEDELSAITDTATQEPARRVRKARTEVDEVAEEPKPRKDYVQLEARTKRIPQEQIETWPQVSEQVLEQIVGVIRDAKKEIANTQRDERKVMAAHNALNPLVRKLERQLAASRIPPSAKDIHFNIDKLTERNALVAREVTTARHSKQLLAEQVKIAEHFLAKDENNLEDLKRDAKKWKAEWKHQQKHGRIHPLLQEPENTLSYHDGPDDIGLKRSAPPDTTFFDTPDPEFATVLEQLRRSLENMQGNHAQVDGINEALSSAQAALDEVFFRQVSAQQYLAV